MGILQLIKTTSFIVGIALFVMAGWTNAVSLVFAGVGFFGFFSILLGSETIQKRYHSLDLEALDPIRKFREWGDVAQGVIFVILGVVVVGFSVSLAMGLSRTLISFLVRRPGPILFALSVVCFLRAVNIIAGSKQKNSKQGGYHPETFFQWVEYFFSNLIPAVFLFFLGLVLFGMGAFETITPDSFDQLGGRFIETFFGGW